MLFPPPASERRAVLPTSASVTVSASGASHSYRGGAAGRDAREIREFSVYNVISRFSHVAFFEIYN